MSDPLHFPQVVHDRLCRSALAALGLAVSAFGCYLQIPSNMGISPWQALNQGLSLHLPISFGTASVLVSLLIILADVLMHEPIGVGTILDALVFGWSTDLYLWLDLVPAQHSFPMQLGLMLVGLVISSVGVWMYMLPGLSCGPRDSLMVGLGKRFPKLSIGTINILMMGVVLVIARMLGGQLGLGTLITIFGTGAVMDLVFKVLHFEPRSIRHESLADTAAALSAARRQARRAHV